jgi:hypothetical protein
MFEMMALAGGFWFFLFVMVVLVVGVIASEMDSFFAGTVTFVLTLAGLQLFGYPIFTAILGYPIFLLIFLAIYVAAGSAYAVFYRYPRMLNSNKDKIRSEYEYFLRDGNKFESDQSYDEFMDSYRYQTFRPGSNLDSISTWVLMWPWGLFWDLLHRPIIWIYNNMYTGIGQALEKVGKSVTRRILKSTRP